MRVACGVPRGAGSRRGYAGLVAAVARRGLHLRNAVDRVPLLTLAPAAMADEEASDRDMDSTSCATRVPAGALTTRNVTSRTVHPRRATAVGCAARAGALGG